MLGPALRLKAELSQLPRVWIAESSRPATAAVVAAPIQKLCAELSLAGRLACLYMFNKAWL